MLQAQKHRRLLQRRKVKDTAQTGRQAQGAAKERATLPGPKRVGTKRTGKGKGNAQNKGPSSGAKGEVSAWKEAQADSSKK